MEDPGEEEEEGQREKEPEMWRAGWGGWETEEDGGCEKDYKDKDSRVTLNFYCQRDVAVK